MFRFGEPWSHARRQRIAKEAAVRFVQRVQEEVHTIGTALRRPEDFVAGWRESGSARGAWPFAALFLNAALCLAAYGMTVGFNRPGVTPMFDSSLRTVVAAGLPWLLALPGLYILNSAFGSRLDASTTFLAVLTTLSFGGLGLLVSMPVIWLFAVAAPFFAVHFLLNVLVLLTVAVAMLRMFHRVMSAIDPERKGPFPEVWLLLVFVLVVELMFVFHPLSQ
jgi:uncharacterized membrane protein YidH (DUF202 family)